MSSASTQQAEPPTRGRSALPNRVSPSARAILDWLLPFALVVYLGLRGGGYDPVVRGEVCVVLWLALLMGGAAGLLPAARLSRGSCVVLALLTAFTAWTALSATWSESVERSLDSFVLVATYLAAFALVLFIACRERPERILSAVGAGIAVVAAIALLSRLHPQWFPTNSALDVLPPAKSRLNYPLNSWNGLGTLLAMGIPLLLAGVIDARSRHVRIAATIAVPVASLALFFTVSRAGMVAAAIGVGAFLALRSRRVRALPTLALIAGGSALLIAVASGFGPLKAGLSTSLAHQQGGEMAAVVVAVCIVAGWLRSRLDRAESDGRLAIPEPSRKLTGRLVAAGAAALVIAVLAAGAAGVLTHAWDRFKAGPALTGTTERLQDTSGNGRYQYWQASVDEMQTSPLQGTGAGTFQLWWARHSTLPGFQAYAHSAYFETLGETGIVGFILISGTLGAILVAGIGRAVGSAGGRRRGWLAGAAGSAIAFALAMALDWGWHIAVIPVAFLLVAAAALQSERPQDGDIGRRNGDRQRRRRLIARFAIPIVALPIVAVSLASVVGTRLISDSQHDARANELDAALGGAQDASTFMPWAGMPHEQQALVLERQRDYPAAREEALQAIQKEHTSWEPYYVLSRIDEKAGNLAAARAEYAKARSLDIHSSVFLDHPNRKTP